MEPLKSEPITTNEHTQDTNPVKFHNWSPKDTLEALKKQDDKFPFAMALDDSLDVVLGSAYTFSIGLTSSEILRGAIPTNIELPECKSISSKSSLDEIIVAVKKLRYMVENGELQATVTRAELTDTKTMFTTAFEQMEKAWKQSREMELVLTQTFYEGDAVLNNEARKKFLETLIGMQTATTSKINLAENDVIAKEWGFMKNRRGDTYKSLL